MNQPDHIQKNNTPHYLATVLLFAPLFFQRVFVGAAGSSYSEYPGFSLSFLGYIAHLALIVLALLYPHNRGPQIKKSILLLFLALFCILSLTHLYLTSTTTEFTFLELILPLGRGWLWILAIAVYCLFYFTDEIFVRIFTQFCKIAALVLVISIISFWLLDFPFGVHINNGYPRVQGFLSEPSTLAPIFPTFAILSLLRRKWADFSLALGCTLLTASVIVYTVFIGISVSYLLYYKNFIRTFSTFVFIYVFLIVSVVLIPLKNILESTSKVAPPIISWIEEHDGSISHHYHLLKELVSRSDHIAIYDLGNTGVWARLFGSIVTAEELRVNGLQNIGFGLNVYGYMAIDRYGDILDFGLFPYLMSSFGIPLAVLITFVLAYSVIKKIKNKSSIGIIFLGFFFSTLLNSAGGIHSYSALMVCLFSLVAKALPSSLSKQGIYPNAR